MGGVVVCSRSLPAWVSQKHWGQTKALGALPLPVPVRRKSFRTTFRITTSRRFKARVWRQPTFQTCKPLADRLNRQLKSATQELIQIVEAEVRVLNTNCARTSGSILNYEETTHSPGKTPLQGMPWLRVLFPSSIYCLSC